MIFNLSVINLKFVRINRIRLEFKLATSQGIEVGNFCINRIRLEFK